MTYEKNFRKQLQNGKLVIKNNVSAYIGLYQVYYMYRQIDSKLHLRHMTLLTTTSNRNIS